MKLLMVQPSHVDKAWKDGAVCLEQACELVDEITGSQLKMLLARGERVLVAMQDKGEIVGWSCYRVDQLPNLRVLFITDLVAPNAHFEAFWGEVKQLSETLGCSRVRCAAPDAQARLYRMKLGMTPIYTTLEAKI